MPSSLSSLLLVVACLANASAFSTPTTSRRSATTQLSSSSSAGDETPTDSARRGALLGLTAAFTAAAVTSAPRPARATYTAYSNREKDWQERMDKGEIKVSSARELRQQLREIVPQNDDGRSKIFCPNGPSAAVSPLMENKCGDRMAMPSVYGRSDDVMGNSIPGFKAGYDFSGSALSTGIAFPEYKENEYQVKMR